jgi:two-component system alkaline phosphatase synthesis response regulator PhoP
MAKTVLVVEDDQDLRVITLMMLKSLGFAPIGFESARDALTYVQENPIDLALVDVMMPEMNGYELLQELRNKDTLREIPVIMVTAKDGDNDVLTGYQQGADYYITKPFTKEQLRYGIDLCL